MPYHFDDEASIKCNIIASLSIGVTRLFSLRPLYSANISHHIYLPSGSLFVMSGNTQRFWQHSLIKEPHITAPRVNITFRVLK